MKELQTVVRQANRRLYCKTEKRYIKLSDIYDRVVGGFDLMVVDMEKKDITCQVFLQVLAAQEQRAAPLMSLGFLQEAIRIHAKLPGAFATTFLEQSLKLLHTPPLGRKLLKSITTADSPSAARRMAAENFETWRGVLEEIRLIAAKADVADTPEDKSLAQNPLPDLSRNARRSPRESGVTGRR